MKIVKMKTAELIEAPYNPRIMPEEMLKKLKKSIEKFGYVEPLVVNKKNNHVIGGNQRLKVLRELGVDEVEVVLVDLDDRNEKALNLALNRITGDWDYGILSELLKDLEPVQLELTGFDEREIEAIIGGFHASEEMADIEEEGELPKLEDVVVIKVRVPKEKYTEVLDYLEQAGCEVLH